MPGGAYPDLVVAAARLVLAGSPTEAMPEVCRLVCDAEAADIAQFYVVEPDRAHLRVMATHSRPPIDEAGILELIATLAVRLDGSLAGWASTRTDPLVINDVVGQTDHDLPPGYRRFFRRFGLLHFLGIPVHSSTELLGSFVLCRSEGSAPFSDHDVELFSGIGNVAAVAVERAALLHRVARQADLLDRVADAVIAIDEKQTVLKWNRGAETIYGISREDALGRQLTDLFSTVSHTTDDLDLAWQELQHEDGWRESVRQVTRDGRIVEVEASVTSLVDEVSGFSGAVAVNRDVSGAMRARRELAERQAFAEALLDALGGRTLVIDVDGRVRAVNSRYETEGPFGAGPGSGPDKGADALAFFDLASRSTPGVEQVARAVREVLAGGTAPSTFDVPSDRDTWTTAQVQPFRGPGGGALVSLVDVSERKTRELELAHQATHDELTGLPNRALLLDRLRESLRRAHRRRHRLAVMFVDLDGLKAVNDSQGHAAGDALIVAAARRLWSGCRSIDTVARVGGDEFVLLIDEVDDAREAEALANRLLELLARTAGPPLARDEPGPVSASIGVVLAEGSGRPTVDDASEIVGHADAAMLVAKKSGKGQVVLVARPVVSSDHPPTD